MKWHREWQQYIFRNNHFIQAYIWMALGIPTILWWKESILWVAIMSLYANIEASFAAHGSDREKIAMEKKWKKMENKLDQLIGMVEELKGERGARSA